MLTFSIKAVIDWVNEGRRVMGLSPIYDLVPGSKSAAGSCPIARSLKGNPSVEIIRVFPDVVELYKREEQDGHLWYTDRKTVPVPEDVNLFIKAFDDGALPQYDIAVLTMNDYKQAIERMGLD